MKWGAAIALLLLVVVGVSLWRMEMPETLEPAGPASLSATSTAERAAGESAPAEQPSSLQSVVSIDSQPAGHSNALMQPGASPPPPLGIALKDSIEALVDRMRAGDRDATTRLLSELTDCLGYRNANRQVDMALAMEEMSRERRRGVEFLQQMMNRAADTIAELDAQCQDLPDDYDGALLFEVQRRAAEMGDLAGQLAFLVAPSLDLNRGIEQRERLEVFAELAPHIAQRALEHASGQAAFALMSGYDNQPELWRNRRGAQNRPENAAMQRAFAASMPKSPLQQALGSDDARAYQYALLCKRVCNFVDVDIATTTAARLEGGLSSDARTLARNNADELFDRYFAAKPRPDDIDLQALRMATSGFIFRPR